MGCHIIYPKLRSFKDLFFDFLKTAFKFVIYFSAIILIPVFLISKCQDTDWYKEKQRQDEAEAKIRATPHVIRESDGCKVYAFEKDSREHYFTRCNTGTVSTERTYSESCGKNCTRQRSEIIITEGNK